MSGSIYCVYITFYSGNKLPPFYIGSSNIDKVNNGYKGSIRSKKYYNVWKNELQSNPHLFKTKIISTHADRRIALCREYSLQKLLNVVRNPLYINQSLSSKNGFFGHDVSGKNNPNYGKKWTEEQREKASIKIKEEYKTGYRTVPKSCFRDKYGKNNPNYGKKWTEEQREKCRGKNNHMYGKGFVGENNAMYGAHGQLHPRAKIYKVFHVKNNITYLIYDRKIFEKDFDICFLSLFNSYKKKTKITKATKCIITEILPRDQSKTIPYEIIC